MLRKTDKNRKVTNGKVDLIGDLAESQFVGAVGEGNGG